MHEVTVTYNGGRANETASKVVQIANCYRGSIRIQKDGRRAQATSKIGILSLELTAGDEITLVIDTAPYNNEKEVADKLRVCFEQSDEYPDLRGLNPKAREKESDCY